MPTQPLFVADPTADRAADPARVRAVLAASSGRVSRLPWEIESPYDADGSPGALRPDAPDARDAPRGRDARDAPRGRDALDALDDPGVPDDRQTPSAPQLSGDEPVARASRFRVGVGAVVVLVIIALVCAVLVSIFAGRGQTEVVPLPPGGRPAVSVPSVSPIPSGAAGSSSPPPQDAPSGVNSPVASLPSASAPLLLHVLGAVARPGLYELHLGDRVVDAVAAAGGFAANADQGQQNLARVVTDGEQLVIPEQGAAPPLGSAAAGGGAAGGGGGGGGGAGAGGAGAGGAGAGGAAAPLVNLNTADQATLETLPQVGPALAQRIIAWRTTNGRFTQLDDLKNVTGIGDKTFEALKPLVTI